MVEAGWRAVHRDGRDLRVRNPEGFQEVLDRRAPDEAPVHHVALAVRHAAPAVREREVVQIPMKNDRSPGHGEWLTDRAVD